MKKVLKSLVLLVVALLLMTQTSVHADMGAPTFISYQMQVINPNGVPYYNYDDSLKGTIPKDTIVTIEDSRGREHELTLCQEWPIRQARPCAERLPANIPLITGQRVMDTMFPIPRDSV